MIKAGSLGRTDLFFVLSSFSFIANSNLKVEMDLKDMIFVNSSYICIHLRI